MVKLKKIINNETEYRFALAMIEPFLKKGFEQLMPEEDEELGRRLENENGPSFGQTGELHGTADLGTTRSQCLDGGEGMAQCGSSRKLRDDEV